MAMKTVVDQTQNRDVAEKARTDLLAQINWQTNAATRLPELVEQVVGIAQNTLGGTASSVLMLDETTQELYFELANGAAGDQLKQMRISAKSGVAGWVVEHGLPLIVNKVNSDQRFYRTVDRTTGFSTESILACPLAVNGRTIGVLEVINKRDGGDFTQNDLDAIGPIASIAAIAIENTMLHQAVTDGYKSTIKALAATIDAKDPYTRGHSERVMKYALMGAHAMSLPERALETIEYASILHDTGKIGIPDSILGKPGPLTAGEFDIIRQHPSIGANICKDIPFLKEARPLILHHHEKFDGTGYPGRISYREIPEGALVIAVADSFDAITTNRAYRPALGVDQAIAELRRCSGTQFCPEVVVAFVSSLEHYMGNFGNSTEGAR
jgi:HD-GYP domain-containing protein (c-di-GMP phosphodiesterase class II)